MKLSLEQRTKLFSIVRETVLKNKDKIKIISSDHPNKSFIYEDSKYRILYYYNEKVIDITTVKMIQISLENKDIGHSIRFDSGDYMIMKNSKDMHSLASEIEKTVFVIDDVKIEEDCEDQEMINKVLDK